MSEKRYKFGIIKGSRQAHIIDCHTCKSTTIDVYDDNIKYFVDKLNEQQATNSALRTENNHLIDVIKEYAKKYEEQEATIRKLQDLCGKSDYENVKLRQEIKELKAQLREKEEDERLYANEIVKLNKEAKEVLDFKSLGGDY